MTKTNVTDRSTQRDAIKSAPTGSLKERGKAIEDKYFHERDQELIRKMQEKDKPADADKQGDKEAPKKGDAAPKK